MPDQDLDDIKTFPVGLIKPVNAEFGGSLDFNPHAGLPPTIWYSVGIELAPIELGDNAYAPDLYGDTLETELTLGGIVLPARSWKQLPGEYGPVEDTGESSVYVSQSHVPIDIKTVKLTRLAGTRFEIELDLAIDFEDADAGYRNAEVSVKVEAEYAGLGFHVPRWSAPDSVQFPVDWKIPEQFDEASVRELFGRFVNVDEYTLTRDREAYELHPLRD